MKASPSQWATASICLELTARPENKLSAAKASIPAEKAQRGRVRRWGEKSVSASNPAETALAKPRTAVAFIGWKDAGEDGF